MPVRYQQIAKGVFAGEFDSGDRRFQAGLENWIANLGEVHRARFFALPGDRLRYEISSTAAGVLNYRVGIWKQAWRGALLASFEPAEESLATHRGRCSRM